MGHNDRAKHTHHDEHTPGGQRGRHGAAQGGRPVGVDKRQFVKVRETDERNEGNDALFDPAVGVGEEQDGRNCRRSRRAERNGQAEKHFERNGCTQDFGERRRHRSGHGAPQHGARYGRAQVARRGLGQAKARSDAQVGHVVLQYDEHHGRKRHDPEQGVAELRASGKIRRPVARIDEAYGDKQPRPDVAQDVKAARAARLAQAPVVADVSDVVSESFHVREDCTGQR